MYKSIALVLIDPIRLPGLVVVWVVHSKCFHIPQKWQPPVYNSSLRTLCYTSIQTTAPYRNHSLCQTRSYQREKQIIIFMAMIRRNQPLMHTLLSSPWWGWSISCSCFLCVLRSSSHSSLAAPVSLSQKKKPLSAWKVITDQRLSGRRWLLLPCIVIIRHSQNPPIRLERSPHPRSSTITSCDHLHDFRTNH